MRIKLRKPCWDIHSAALNPLEPWWYVLVPPKCGLGLINAVSWSMVLTQTHRRYLCNYSSNSKGVLLGSSQRCGGEVCSQWWGFWLPAAVGAQLPHHSWFVFFFAWAGLKLLVCTGRCLRCGQAHSSASTSLYNWALAPFVRTNGIIPDPCGEMFNFGNASQ